MRSLYAQYLTERTSDHILETAEGFVTYRYLPNGQVYIIDIYVQPQYRKQDYASKMADQICEMAKEAGYTELIGTVIPTTKMATQSILVLIAYGMKVTSAAENLIVFKKGL